MFGKVFNDENEIKRHCKDIKSISITINGFHTTTGKNAPEIRAQVLRMSYTTDMTLVASIRYTSKRTHSDYDGREFRVGEKHETFWFASKGNENKVMEQLVKYNSQDTSDEIVMIFKYI